MGNEKGFTLIEMILTVVLIGIVSIALTSAFVPTMTVSVDVDNRKEAFQHGRLAIERMMREIREARSFSAGFSGTSVTFTNAANASATYSWSGAALAPLQRNGVDLACCVQSLLFDYLKKDGAAAGGPTEIWRVRANLQLQVGAQTVELRSEAHPRGVF
ncbi:MAG TPA: type II secretion system protein [Candidatus Manganitrophaceae bacterium]|nr:type II secretion system protein [Candidatus Manganitrophaceae bacterium]